MDLIHKVLKWLDHNRYLALGVLIVALTCGVQFGCQSTTRWGVGDKSVEVTRPELEQQLNLAATDLDKRQAALNADRDALIAAGELAIADLDRKDAAKTMVLTTIGELVQSAATGGFDPVSAGLGLFTLATGLLGGGAVLDNRRKDGALEKLRAERDALKARVAA